MKTMDEIRQDRRLQIHQIAEDGGNGWVTIRGKTMCVVFSWGGGWDHVSASFTNRTPTWDEMCVLKDIFFREDECCVEYHPAYSNYVNIHPYCLHLWRPQHENIPTPPNIYV